MAPKQRMRLANEKHSQNVNLRGNVPKTMVRFLVYLLFLHTDDMSTTKKYIFPEMYMNCREIVTQNPIPETRSLHESDLGHLLI